LRWRIAAKWLFEKAVLYGGTALRIFYGPKRFSEQPDVSLLEVKPDFQLQPYVKDKLSKFNGLGYTWPLGEDQE
jgi:hypothetical protein